MFVRNQSNVLASRGGDATFVCDAKEAPGEFPLPPPRWFINGRPLELEVHPSEYTLSPDKKRVTFRGLTDNSTRGIQCNVTNQRGYAFWDGYLKVIGKQNKTNTEYVTGRDQFLDNRTFKRSTPLKQTERPTL
ncbi:hypothetical protein C0Q70_07693 [Pomacea canaliculata]|uniref:Ig-like domain-containing protein n=1 Tax=Pomacea canaliculata TaxID=400727 RepID=A0A2T7PFV7_POMCA|nr:hypothetical protein C0Q70_07693 [Pomacea canaliculata]